MGFVARLDTSVLKTYGPNSPFQAEKTASGLPQGWEVRMSQSRNLPYYFSPTTSTSRWEPPDGTDREALSKHMAANFSVTGAPTDSDSISAGKIRTAHLLVKHNGSRNPSSWRENKITRSKEEAINILKGHEARIRAKEISLGDLARTESDCPSARKAGDLGFFGHGEMQKEFEQAAFALQPGEMSSVVETASGVHLIER